MPTCRRPPLRPRTTSGSPRCRPCSPAPTRSATRPRGTWWGSPLSLPVGFTRGGLPLAVQLVGPPSAEARLLQVAAQLKAAGDQLARWPTGDPSTRGDHDVSMR